MSENIAITTTQEKNIADSVLTRVHDLNKKGDLAIPSGYSPENALKSAWLILQDVKDRNNQLALQTCTKESIANALLDMVVQGLSPLKKQCYFIVYGNKLTLSRSYLGSIAVTKRLQGVENIFYNCIYEGDEFEYVIDLESGVKKLTKHDQSFENIDISKIKGAYAVIVKKDGPNYLEVMNISQIRKAWGQGAAKGNSGAHNNFTDEMCIKTVVNRACKRFFNTSDDTEILFDSFNRSDEDRETLDVEYEVKQEIESNANTKAIDFPEQPKKEQVIDVTPNLSTPINDAAQQTIGLEF